jgi:hypothetical protein
MPPRLRATACAVLVAAGALALPGAARAQGKEGPRYPPKMLPYDEAEPVPPGYHVETRAKRSYLLVGASLFGASYLATALATSAVVAARQPDAPRVAPLAIPNAGPFIAIESAHAGVPAGVVLAADGIAQLGGAILFVAGLNIDEQVLVFNTIPATAQLSVGPGSVGIRGSF